MQNDLDVGTADRLARLVLAAIRREYPSHILHLLRGDADARPPRELTPAFFGSFDWHSCVHGHWCLCRLARTFPGAPLADAARAVLAASLSPERLAGEVDYLGVEGRQGFERPYGLAWLLQLCAELLEWDDPVARACRSALEPLESLAVRRLSGWLERLPWPIRSGEHPQTAFAMGLALDWARAAGNETFAALIVRRSREYHGADVEAPIAYEPSGHDFLSPALGEADLMRRVLARGEFADWLARFLPDLPGASATRWLTPVASPDRSDGKLAHLDGLNLSRAWMLEGVASALDPGDGRRGLLIDRSRAHAAAGLAAVTGEHYEGSHWLGTFAVYLLTRRGVA
jgi:hypothetical protein